MSDFVIRTDSAQADTVEEVVRRDHMETLGPPEVTPEGFLIFDGYVVKPGILTYEDGTRELVPPETLHDPESLRTLALRPLTFEHPDPAIYPDMVTPDNEADLSIGTTGENPRVTMDGRVAFKIVARRRDGIDRILQMRDAGKVLGLSTGCRCTLDRTPGVDPVYGPYDAIQRRRVYNHLAITDSPRAGSGAHFRLDSEKTMKNALLHALSILGIDASVAEKPEAEIITALDAAKPPVKPEEKPEVPDEDAAVQAKAQRAMGRKARRALDAVAAEYKVQDSDDMDDDELQEKILDAAGFKMKTYDGVDPKLARSIAYDAFIAGRPAPKGKRTDSKPGAEGSGEGVPPVVEAFRLDGHGKPEIVDVDSVYDRK